MAKKKTQKKSKTRSAGRAPARKATARAKKPSKLASTLATQARVHAIAKVFTALGARNAEQWARTHVDDGSDELGRFVLLRALWLRAVEPGRLLAAARADSAAGSACDRLMQIAELADLDALVRYAQRQSLADLCSVLDDPADNNDGIRWRLFRVDAKGAPLWPLDRLRTGLTDSEP